MDFHLRVLVGARSPWAPAALGAMAKTGVMLHVVCVENPRGASYTALDEGMAQAWQRVESQCASFNWLHLKRKGYASVLECAAALRRGPKVDHTLCLYGGLFAMAAMLSGVRPYSVYLVGSDVLTLSRLARPLARVAYCRAKHLVANGPALAEAASAQTSRPGVHELLLGVDTERFACQDPPPFPWHLVCARGFLPVYQNEVIVQALAMLPKDEDWRMTFLAGGPGLEAAKEGAPDGVTFLGGVPPGAIPGHLASAHAFVSMSLSDGTSTAVLEALSCGLPGIVSDIPANGIWARLLPNSLTLVPTGDARRLADAILALKSRGPLGAAERNAQHEALKAIVDSTENMRRLMTLLSGA